MFSCFGFSRFSVSFFVSWGSFGPLFGLLGLLVPFLVCGAFGFVFGLLGLFVSCLVYWGSFGLFVMLMFFIYRYPVKRVPVDEKHEHNHNMAIYIGLPVHGCNPMKKTIDETQVNVTLRAKRQKT